MNASVKLEDLDSSKSIEFTVLEDDKIKINIQGKYHTELTLSKEQMKIAFRFILENKEGDI